MIGITVFFTGCGPSYQEYSTLQNKKEQKQIVTRQQVFTFSDISLISREVDENKSGVDVLIDRSQDYIDYLTFRKNYPDYEQTIISKLREGNFDSADRLVRELRGKLERDENPYARLYLKKVRNFTYTIHEYYTASTGKKTEVVETPWNESIADGLEMVLAPLRFAFTQDLGDYNFIKESEVKKQFFDEILVNPYSGTKRKIRTEVPFDGSLLQIDLERIKSQKAIEKARQERIKKANRTTEEIEAIVNKYESRFNHIKQSTNVDLWASNIANHRYKSAVWVQDLKIRKDILSLYNDLCSEGNHSLYEHLKHKITNFEYFNISVEVKLNNWELFTSGRYSYDKKITEIYSYNPFQNHKVFRPEYQRLIGTHPGHLTRSRTRLQDFFKNKQR